MNLTGVIDRRHPFIDIPYLPGTSGTAVAGANSSHLEPWLASLGSLLSSEILNDKHIQPEGILFVNRLFDTTQFANTTQFLGKFLLTYIDYDLKAEYLTEIQHIERQLLNFEQNYKISSEDFHSRWLRFTEPDTFENNMWASLYEALLRLQRKMNELDNDKGGR